LLIAVSALKALIEIALAFCVGRAIVALFAGKRREGNAVFRFFEMLLKPVFTATRFITPKAIVDQHVPIVAFLLLGWLFLATTQLKVMACADEPEHSACRALKDSKAERTAK
jgi:hypothetical protein